MSKINTVIRPYKEGKDVWKTLTVGMLKDMLKDIPDDYKVKYDSFYGGILKSDFAICDETKEISING